MSKRIVSSTPPETGRSLGSAAIVAVEVFLATAMSVGEGVAVLLPAIRTGVAVGLGVTVGRGVAVGLGVGVGDSVVVTAAPVHEHVVSEEHAGLRQALLIHERPELQSLSVKQAASQAMTVVLLATVVDLVVVVFPEGDAVGTAPIMGVGDAASDRDGDTVSESGWVVMRVSSVDPVLLARVFCALKSSFTVPFTEGTKMTLATFTGELLVNGWLAFCVIMA